MRLLAIGLILLQGVAFAQRFDRFNSRCSGGRSSRGLSCDNYAFIEVSPPSGAGLSAACSCANITGARGEPIVTTRASSAMCAKQGNAMTGITNSDLVLCGNDLPRVELTGGVLGVRTEGSVTNLMLRSDSVDNAAWVKEQDAAPRTPTVTADQGVAPDGTTTAERVQFPATTGAQFSDYYQIGTTSLSTGWTCSMYIKGFSGSGTTDLCSFNTTTGWLCTSCDFVSGSWSRCVSKRSTSSGVVGYCRIGNNSAQNGGIARTASDVLVWGHQGEERGFATAIVPTVASTATKPADAMTMAVTDIADTTMCVAATVEPLWASTAEAPTGVAGSIGFSSPTSAISFNSGVPRAAFGLGVATTTFFGSGPNRLRGTDNTVKVAVYHGSNSSDVDAGVVADRWGSSFRLTGSTTVFGIISGVQADPSPTRCQ